MLFQISAHSAKTCSNSVSPGGRTLERVHELSDASVLFPFDVHATVWSEDAPALECAIHQHFRDRSVNLANPRKRFFRVSLAEIEAFFTQRGIAVKLTLLAEAREYRQTLVLLAKASSNGLQAAKKHFPSMPDEPVRGTSSIINRQAGIGTCIPQKPASTTPSRMLRHRRPQSVVVVLTQLYK